jgi:hypothetical protein
MHGSEKLVDGPKPVSRVCDSSASFAEARAYRPRCMSCEHGFFGFDITFSQISRTCFEGKKKHMEAWQNDWRAFACPCKLQNRHGRKRHVQTRGILHICA